MVARTHGTIHLGRIVTQDTVDVRTTFQFVRPVLGNQTRQLRLDRTRVF